MRSFATRIVLALFVLTAGCSSGSDVKARTIDGSVTLKTVVGLRFDDQGQALRPRGYRSWVHAVTSWAAIGKTPISMTPTKTPELHNLYVEPKAYRTYMETGKWPEGTVLVKEFLQTSVDSGHCGGPPAFVCNDWFGKNIMDHGPTGIAVMLKDTKRYPHEPGGWAYFDYGHEQPPYRISAAPHTRKECAACHIQHAGAHQDYVFSVDRPGLSRTGDDAVQNLQASLPD